MWLYQRHLAMLIKNHAPNLNTKTRFCWIATAPFSMALQIVKSTAPLKNMKM